MKRNEIQRQGIEANKIEPHDLFWPPQAAKTGGSYIPETMKVNI